MMLLLFCKWIDLLERMELYQAYLMIFSFNTIVAHETSVKLVDFLNGWITAWSIGWWELAQNNLRMNFAFIFISIRINRKKHCS